MHQLLSKSFLLRTGLILLPVTSGWAEESSFTTEFLDQMNAAVESSIKRKLMPGGVLWLEREGEVYKKAYGKRAIVPRCEPMTLGTIFDAASLTKVVATTPCILKLVEDRRISLDDKITSYLPEFSGDPNKPAVTIRHLLTHTSGLLPGIRKGFEWHSHETGIALATSESSRGHAGYDYAYSDINFILLGEIVRRVTGQSLSSYAQLTIFGPLRMTETGFQPKVDDITRIAPTTRMEDGHVLRGTVHDPTARAMGGEAGHAGLFTTAHDLARYCRMILNGGEIEGTRVLQPATVRLMHTVQSPRLITVRRGLGFDIDSPYAGARGSLFPLGSFGHTGWTGTSLWIDPFSRTTVIFLSNRNHPSGGNVLKLRHLLGTLAAKATGYEFSKASSTLPVLSEKDRQEARGRIVRPPARVLSGIDVLQAENFAPLRGLKVGLITNQTGLSRDHETTIDLLHQSDEVHLVSLFGPEHGIRGIHDGKVEDGVDTRTGVPVRSLYAGEDRRKPREEHLANLDALVFDIQDIGCRFYTYISTMGLCMEAADEAGIQFVVLDRVNPLGGEKVAGPLRDGESKFIAFHDIPIQHGMTVGEIARLYRAERFPGLELTVVPLRNWRRSMRFDDTDLSWTKPSPNMPNLTAATLYPGIGLLEFTNLSVGRGTNLPFELVGAPYITPEDLSEALASFRLPGLQFIPVRFTPESSVFEGEPCGGVRILLKNPAKCPAVELGVVLGQTLRRLYPAQWKTQKLNTLLCHPATEQGILALNSRTSITSRWAEDLAAFSDRRTKHLLYE